MPKVKIKDIKKIIGNGYEIKGTITRKEKTQRSMWREHALSTLEDDTGSILLNLWKDQVNQVSVGDTVYLKNAFTQRRKGVVELSTWEEKIEVLKSETQKATKAKKTKDRSV